MLKRSLDVLLAGLLLAASLPFLALLALAIRLESPGPALFRQTRMGRGFRPFALLKLRTMGGHGEEHPFTLGEDPRITRLGRWLRRNKLDELPQLWNVLRGQMSMVGPRPVIPSLVFEFRTAYRQLLTVRPGLTDPATIKYCRETELLAQAAHPMAYFKRIVTPDKLRISADYLQRATLWSDLGVLLRTAGALLPVKRGKAAPRLSPFAGVR